MISLQHSVPEIYYSQSRDFQFLARALEVLVNYAKTNVDEMRAFPFSANFDVHLLTLLAYTLGFSSKHNYNSEDLFNLCASFSEILKYKGSIEAVEMSIRTLLNAQQIDKEFRVETNNDDSCDLIIKIPMEVKDLILLEDLFDYILPCGFTYSFIYSEFGEEYDGVKLKDTEEAKIQSYASNKLGTIASNTSPRFDYTSPQSELAQVSTGVIVGKDE